MKKAILLITVFCFVHFAFAQQTQYRHTTLKWAPVGMMTGSLNIQGEFNTGSRNSVTAMVGIPVSSRYNFNFDDNAALIDMKSVAMMAGFRRYFSKKPMRGLYLEPYAKYMHSTGAGTGNSTLNNKPVVMNFTNNYKSVGVGAQLGAQFIISNRIVVDLYFLGPEINSVSNNLKAVEATSNIPWNQVEADEAEQTIRRYLNSYPFIKDKSNVSVNTQTRTVTTDFKGALPGFRAGISFGVAL